jgi:predicted small lipoprotein YifL
VKRFVATLLLALLAAAACAGDRPGPLEYPPSSDASLPDLGDSEVSRASGDAQSPRSERAPISVEWYRAPRPFLEPRPYWESDPLFTAPPP